MTTLEINGVCTTWHIINECWDVISIHEWTPLGFLGNCMIKVMSKAGCFVSGVVSRLKNRGIRNIIQTR